MHSDKPISLTVKDYIIRRLSSKLRKDEEVIAAVITHQYSTGNAAVKTNNQIEFSGLGKFMFSEKKANKKLEKYYNLREILIVLRDQGHKPGHYEKKLTQLESDIKYIETKLNVVRED